VHLVYASSKDYLVAVTTGQELSKVHLDERINETFKLGFMEEHQSITVLELGREKVALRESRT
jgi:hypothetical protein